MVSVHTVASEGKGEKGVIKTWVDSVPVAELKHAALTQDGRFAIEASALYLLSSQKPGMMPGRVCIRSVRVEPGAAKDADV